MKKYYGNYLGLCVDNNDPQKRGRVQIFIPHIMPALFKNWNDVGQDIQLLCVGDNLPNSIPSDTLEKLKKILPWAEAASPVMGTSAPGNLAPASPSVVGGMAGAGVAVPQGGSFYDQSPVPEPDFAGVESAPSGVVATVSPTDNVSSGAHLDVRWTPGTNSSTSVPSLDLVGKYIQVGGVPANQLRVTDGPTGPNGTNFGSGRSLARHPAWDLAFQQSGAIAGAPITLTNGAYVAYGKDSSRMGSAYADIITPEGSLRLYHLTTGSVRVGGTGRTTSTSQQALPSVFNSSNPIDDRASAAVPTAGNTGGGGGTLSVPGVGQMGGSSGSILVDQNNRVSRTQLNSYLANAINSNPSSIYNSGKPPANGSKYRIDGSAQSWTNFYTQLAGHESSYYNVDFKNDINGVPEPGGSGGLFQLGRDQIEIWANVKPELAQRWGFQKGVNYSEQQYLNPEFNARGMLFIGEALLSNDYTVGPKQGLGRTIGSLSWNKIAAGVDPGDGALNPSLQPGTAGAATTSPGYNTASTGLPQPNGNLVMNQDTHGPTPLININNMAAGMFSYPAAGALLWTFFREGNPLFPVYFGANYGEREWASAYRLPGAGQDGVGYKPAPSDANPVTSVGGTWNMGKVAVHQWHYINDPNNPINNERSYSIGGHDGSNIAFTEGLQTFLSKFDRRDQIEGDHWKYVGGFTEEWYQGNKNTNHLGDVVIRIGNTSQQAVDAVNQINGYINQIMAPLTQSSGSSTESTASPGVNDGSVQANLEGIPGEDLPPMGGVNAGTTSGLDGGTNPTTFIASAPKESISYFNNLAEQAAASNFSSPSYIANGLGTIETPAQVVNANQQPTSYQPTGPVTTTSVRNNAGQVTTTTGPLLTEQDLQNLGFKPR
jgi:hypothetical protein